MIRLRDGILGAVEGIELGALKRIGEGREAEGFENTSARARRSAGSAPSASLRRALRHEDELPPRRRALQQLVCVAGFGEGKALGDDGVDVARPMQLEQCLEVLG